VDCRALRQGTAIFCKKPIAPTPADAMARVASGWSELVVSRVEPFHPAL
jgi:hypothetical protein